MMHATCMQLYGPVLLMQLQTGPPEDCQGAVLAWSSSAQELVHLAVDRQLVIILLPVAVWLPDRLPDRYRLPDQPLWLWRTVL